MLSMTYGNYAKLNYQHDPESAFAPEEAEWVTAKLRSLRLRT